MSCLPSSNVRYILACSLILCGRHTVVSNADAIRNMLNAVSTNKCTQKTAALLHVRQLCLIGLDFEMFHS